MRGGWEKMPGVGGGGLAARELEKFENFVASFCAEYGDWRIDWACGTGKIACATVGDMNEPRLKIPFLEGTWTSDKGMSLFLVILIVVIFVVFPLAGMGVFERFLVDIGFSALLISGALANRENRALTAVVIVLTIGVVTIHWVSLYVSGKQHPLLDASFVMGLFACFVVIMLMEVFRPGAITLHRVQGAVAGYLSFGITW